MGITLNTAQVCDNSTLTNFKAWSKAIADFLKTTGSGLTQTADTGQVNWSSIASVPTVGTYVYEMYTNTDALATFYFKIEYGTGSGSSNTGPNIRVTIGSGTNGAGTLTGFVTNAMTQSGTGVITVPSTVTQYQCYFSAAPGRLGILLWRDSSSTSAPLFFGFERSCDSSGNYTGDFITLLLAMNASGSTRCIQQHSLAFGIGVNTGIANGSNAEWIALKNRGVSSDNFNGNFSVSPVFPSVDGFGNPHRIIMIGCLSDVTEGGVITIAAGNMPYGVAKTYIGTKNGVAMNSLLLGGNTALLMEYD
jgi:hypothetical protein